MASSRVGATTRKDGAAAAPPSKGFECKALALDGLSRCESECAPDRFKVEARHSKGSGELFRRCGGER